MIEHHGAATTKTAYPPYIYPHSPLPLLASPQLSNKTTALLPSLFANMKFSQSIITLSAVAGIVFAGPVTKRQAPAITDGMQAPPFQAVRKKKR